MSTESAAQGRKLNMEEKRRLEKLILSDIDDAISRYSTKRSSERSRLVEEAAEHQRARSLFKKYQTAKSEMAGHEAALNRLGFGISHYPKDNLTVLNSDRIATIRDHDAATQKTKNALTGMKRTYTLNLYAGGEEAQQLISTLSAELERLTK